MNQGQALPDRCFIRKLAGTDKALSLQAGKIADSRQLGRNATTVEIALYGMNFLLALPKVTR
jgi:hypothetical protein